MEATQLLVGDEARQDLPPLKALRGRRAVWSCGAGVILLVATVQTAPMRVLVLDLESPRLYETMYAEGRRLFTSVNGLDRPITPPSNRAATASADLGGLGAPAPEQSAGQLVHQPFMQLAHRPASQLSIKTTKIATNMGN